MDDLGLGHSFPHTAAHVLLGWLMVAQVHEDDAIESSGRPAVAPRLSRWLSSLPRWAIISPPLTARQYRAIEYEEGIGDLRKGEVRVGMFG